MSRPKDDLEWHSDTPPKRGAYKVKSDGPSANHGWRYWDGADWGPLSSSRTWCLEGRKLYWRKSRLRYPVLWATKVEAPNALAMAKKALGYLDVNLFISARGELHRLVAVLEKASP